MMQNLIRNWLAVGNWHEEFDSSTQKSQKFALWLGPFEKGLERLN